MTCSEDMQHEPTAWTSSTDMQQGHAAGTYSKETKFPFKKHAAWACRKDITCSMDMGMQHGSTAWTYSKTCGIDMDLLHGR
jgi:hypothetical protein